MYSEVKKATLRRREKAIKKGIDCRYLALGDAWINKALFLRERAQPSSTDRNYDRAITQLMMARDVFDACIDDRFSRMNNKLLKKELSK
ncbi:hypothetical protein [Vibrio parahaemolyticus]|uniref:hypothetical protein n=1 Tax=Vibrio parahaemolyticus TaxID=670 RepID=UPI00111CB9C9|nr:hypothetical protein [Vibrio parahaemolyticus]TNY96442.1 hypothetical protein CGK56_24275 [Vibrio parahaemolyticus]